MQVLMYSRLIAPFMHYNPKAIFWDLILDLWSAYRALNYSFNIILLSPCNFFCFFFVFCTMINPKILWELWCHSGRYFCDKISKNRNFWWFFNYHSYLVLRVTMNKTNYHKIQPDQKLYYDNQILSENYCRYHPGVLFLFHRT